MSGKVSGWAWDQDLPVNQKYVLLCYADHADHDGGSVFPSLELVAEKTGYTKRNVRRITRRLEESGFLIPVGDQKGGRSATNEWRIPISGGLKGDTSVRLSASKRRTPRVKRGTPGSEKADRAVSADPSLTVKEPSMSNGRQKTVDILSRHFEKISGCPWPDPKSKSDWQDVSVTWLKPIKRWAKLVNNDPRRGKQLIEWALLRADGEYTISQPKSIDREVTAIMGEINRGKFRPPEGWATDDWMAD